MYDPGSLAFFGRFLLILAAVFAVLGIVLILLPHIPYLGRLPGDIIIRKKNFVLYFPLATSILLSIILTVILWLARR